MTKIRKAPVGAVAIKKCEPDLLIWIEEETLSDGSKVYNVSLGCEKFAATDLDAAEALAGDMVAAINENTDTVAAWLHNR